jgi:O-antigen ligase
MAAIPVAVAAAFMTSRGVIGTLTSFFLAGSSDSSVAHRVNTYPMVFELVRRAPLLGQGGATYIASSSVTILDNEYLTIAIELGILGLVAFAFFVFWPGVVALYARAHSVNQELRDLCAALAGATFAGAVCSATFDSLSFPMYYNVQALVVGLVGTVWLLVRKERNAASRPIGWTTTI